MAINEMIKLISSIMNIDDPNVEAQPGIANAVVVFITNMLMMEISDNKISKNEIMATLIIIFSKKTAMAPNPCSSRELKFIFDLPA